MAIYNGPKKTHFGGAISQGANSVETIAAAKTLVAADIGQTFILSAAGGATITLPALSAGARLKFVIGSTFATTNWVIDSAEGDNIHGSITVAGVVVVAAAEDQINFVATAEAIGDWIELLSDGTYWYVSGQAALSGGITATDPS